MKKDFEFIEHTADVKVRVYGETLKELFQNSLKALFQTVLPKAQGCFLREELEVCNEFPIKKKISITSSNKEALLVDFLSEVLCLMDTHNEAYGEVTIRLLSDTEMEATLNGVSVVSFQGQDVKAITYHELAIENIDNVWQSTIVFDV